MIKVNIPRLSVEQSIAEFSQRRERLLGLMAAQPLKSDPHGGVAIAQLASGADPREPNNLLRRAAAWFEYPPPNGRDPQGEVDFIALNLARAYHQFPGGGPQARIEEETRAAIRKFFLTKNFASKYHSENHHLLFHTSRLLMAHDLPDETFTAFKLTGQQAMQEDREWLRAFIEYRARCGWGEFDSPHYIETDLECLLTLHDFSPDAELQKMVRMMLDLLLTDAVVEGRHGMLSGGTGRIYQRNALDHANNEWYALSYLYFGDVDVSPVRRCTVEALVSRYRPDPLVVRIALERSGTYENRERKHLHNLTDVRPVHPLPGSIRKVTHLTERYGLGSVTLQDPYPPDLPKPNYAGHEQHDWDLTIFSRTDARLFSHHPGKSGEEHGYWTGDFGCRCGHFFQNKTASLALYAIPTDQPYQMIHAYVPRSAFEEVLEKNGVVFVRENGVYAALRLLGGYQWTTDGPWKDKEITSPGSPNGAICEVSEDTEYSTFAAFQDAVLAAKVEFDRNALRLVYHSTRSGVLTLGADATRLIDGKPADLNYPTYDCPYLHSAWNSGVVEMRHGKTRRRLDFVSITDQTEAA